VLPNPFLQFSSFFIASEINMNFSARATWAGVSHFPQSYLSYFRLEYGLRRDVSPAIMTLFIKGKFFFNITSKTVTYNGLCQAYRPVSVTPSSIQWLLS